MINLDYYYEQDPDDLTENELDYVNLVETCQEYDGDCPEEDIIHLKGTIKDMKLTDIDFPSLFIEALEFGNKNMSEMFLSKGFDINDNYIVDSFKEYCCYDQMDLIIYLLSKGFNLTTKLFNEIQYEFENGTKTGVKDQSTLDYLSSIIQMNKFKKIMKLKMRISEKTKSEN